MDGSDYTRFCVLDMDRDGLNELVVSYKNILN